MTKGELAKNYFLSGYNCSTSVVMAFKEEIGLSTEVIEKMAIGFGGGFARQRLTCGAVSGMGMVISLIKSDGKDKAYIYDLIQKACKEAENTLGSIICGELLSGKVTVTKGGSPDERTEEYYKKRPCAEICEICADIAEKFIKN